MRLLIRIYRFLAGKCEACGTRLTKLELEFGFHNCMGCESRLDQ